MVDERETGKVLVGESKIAVVVVEKYSESQRKVVHRIPRGSLHSYSQRRFTIIIEAVTLVDELHSSHYDDFQSFRRPNRKVGDSIEPCVLQ